MTGLPSRPPRERGLLARIQASNLALSIALLGALVLMLGVVNWHYPVGTWLFWRYLRVWLLAIFWVVSCFSGGTFLLARLRIRIQHGSVEAVLAVSLGVLAFQLSIFLLGLAGLLGAATFFLVPVAFALLGARNLRQAALSLKGNIFPPTTFLQLGVAVFGVAGAAVLYFQILSPETFHWDARWYHLPIAQQYALQGAVRPFPEGWWLDAYPHSGSLLYTWAFLMPGTILFDRLELCIHLEFVVFLLTIASVPALVRELVPGLTGRGAWAAIFLFPGIFLYDSNLAGAADHLAALWCIPIVLSLCALWTEWRVPQAVLFGVFIGAALAAKYSAWSMVVFPGGCFLFRAVGLGARNVIARHRAPTGSRWSVLGPFACAVGAMLAVSAQHWLRNWICYGDPLYPILHRYFHGRPWSSESLTSYLVFKSFSVPPAPGWQGVRDALQAVFTFAFIPNDWPVFHRNVPVFGFLFTLSMFCLPFVRAGARLLLGYLGAMVAIAAWYLTTREDRYLQAWLPVMVACTAATLELVWQRRNLAVRCGVAALIALQIIWGGDIPFFPTHNLINDSPAHVVSNFLASGFLHRPDRFRLFGDEGLVAERLPPDANLLLHEENMHVGFGVRAVSDQWQGRLSYASLGSPAAIYKELADMKVTHMLWEGSMSGWNSLGHDLAFLGFALNFGRNPVALGRFTLAKFPPVPPAAVAFNDKVAVLGCGVPFASGVYRIGQLTTPLPGQAPARPDGPLTDPAAAVAGAGFLVVDPGCTPSLPLEANTGFHSPVLRGALRLYIRRSSGG